MIITKEGPVRKNFSQFIRESYNYRQIRDAGLRDEKGPGDKTCF